MNNCIGALKGLAHIAEAEVTRRGLLYDSWIKYATLNRLSFNRKQHGIQMDKYFVNVSKLFHLYISVYLLYH